MMLMVTMKEQTDLYMNVSLRRYCIFLNLFVLFHLIFLLGKHITLKQTASVLFTAAVVVDVSYLVYSLLRRCDHHNHQTHHTLGRS